jgi:hypothetical protein
MKAFSVQIAEVPSSDPLAYVKGFMDGYGGDKEQKGYGVAAAYTEGYKAGSEVKAGIRPIPAWLERK